jgi:hypothetical protein
VRLPFAWAHVRISLSILLGIFSALALSCSLPLSLSLPLFLVPPLSPPYSLRFPLATFNRMSRSDAPLTHSTQPPVRLRFVTDVYIFVALLHSPKPGPSNFTVIHVNGLHYLNITFCGCSKMNDCNFVQQLLHRGLFPATVQQPQTCSTFQLLHHFHLQSVQSKVSTIHFYQALERETNNTGLIDIKVSYLSIRINHI